MRKRVEQKYVRYSFGYNGWLLGDAGGSSYLASQCPGNSGLEKDLASGWFVKAFWQDHMYVVFLLEKNR